jgi:hypothetical protein
VLLALAGVVSWSVLDTRELLRRRPVLDGCVSDALSALAQDLQIYAEKHDGHFCEPGRVSDMLYQPDHTNFLYCLPSKDPFKWNPDLSRIQLGSSAKRFLAWCPPGAHGRYVGVLTVLQGKVDSEVITVDELRRVQAPVSP